MFSNIRYVLLTALRDRLFFGLLAGILAAAYISSVLGSTAMLEPEQMTLAFTAASARVIIMIGIIVFIGFHMRNAFDSKEIDVLLSRPISRTSLVISYWLGFVAVALGLVLPTIVLMYFMQVLSMTGYMLWAFSLVMESVLVVTIALFASLTVRSGVSAVLASLAIYTLSRMMGFFIATTKAGPMFETQEVNAISQTLMNTISIIVPRLDFFAKSSWLMYGPKSYDELWLVIVQTVAFTALLLIAAIIDFKRKQF